MRVHVRAGVHVYGAIHWLGDESLGLQSGSPRTDFAH